MAEVWTCRVWEGVVVVEEVHGGMILNGRIERAEMIVMGPGRGSSPGGETSSENHGRRLMMRQLRRNQTWNVCLHGNNDNKITNNNDRQCMAVK